jgi:S1-C subfamily serine protease
MRKILLGLVLLIFTSINSFALSEYEIKEKYLSNRQLDPIEGVWQYYSAVDKKYYTEIVYRYGNIFNSIRQSDGQLRWSVSKVSSEVYKGTCIATEYSNWSSSTTDHTGQSLTIRMFSEDNFDFNCSYYVRGNSGALNSKSSRIWPTNLSAHNSQFKSIASKPSSADVQGKPADKPKRGGSGSAFFINSKGSIVTNNHVVEVCSGNIKIIHNKKEITASIIAKDEKLDLAVLSSNIKPQQFIKLSKKSGEKLDKVVTAGYPLGYRISDELKFTSGIVSATKGWKDNINEFQIDAALNPGNSGGPVVNDAGNLFGVAVAGLVDRQNLNFAIKSKAVKDFLDVNKVSYSTATVEFDMDNKKRLKLLEDSTVFIYCN